MSEFRRRKRGKGRQVGTVFPVGKMPTKASLPKGIKLVDRTVKKPIPQRGIPVAGCRGWRNNRTQIEGRVKRWIESDSGDVISVVSGNTKGNERMGIDGEIRCTIGQDAFSIPCSLGVVERKSDYEIVKLCLRSVKRRKIDLRRK